MIVANDPTVKVRKKKKAICYKQEVILKVKLGRFILSYYR